MASSDANPLRPALHNQLKRLIVSATYTTRGHFVESARLATWDGRLGLPATVVSAILSAGAGVATLLKSQPWLIFTLEMLAAARGAYRRLWRIPRTCSCPLRV